MDNENNKDPSKESMIERSVGYALGVTHRKLSQLLAHRLKPYEITPEQWLVLYCANEREGLIQKEIGERSGKDKPTTTRILDTLEDKALLIKKASPSDRRSYRIYPTEKGRNLIAMTIPIEQQTIKEITNKISQEQYEQLLTLLRLMGDNVDELLIDKRK